MTLAVTPTTELQAINVMLAAIGTRPVNSLGEFGLTDANIALETLTNTNREVQSRGWWFNRAYVVQLNPDVDGYITLPLNTLRVAASKPTAAFAGETRLVVVRGTKLFNIGANTFIFSTPVNVELTSLLDFTDLPEVARRYIAVRAARVFQAYSLGDADAGSFNDAYERESWQIMEDEQATSTPSSMFATRMRSRIAALNPDPAAAPSDNRRTQ